MPPIKSMATQSKMYALRGDAGEFELRRVEYDIERAAQGWERTGGTFGELAAQRVLRGSD
jgi:hypothetical protein